MDNDLNYKLIGGRLRAIRKKRGLTQERIAELVELSPQHISGIETGGAKVSLSALVRLCNALDTTPNEILLDSVPSAAKPGLLREVEAVFSDASADEIFIMLAQAKSVKEALRIKGLLVQKEEGMGK